MRISDWSSDVCSSDLFLGLYSLAALATFGWMIGARLGISSDPVWWVAPPWFWDVATLLMLFASVLLAGSLRGNPAAVNPKGRIDRSEERRVGKECVRPGSSRWSP